MKLTPEQHKTIANNLPGARSERIVGYLELEPYTDFDSEDVRAIENIANQPITCNASVIEHCPHKLPLHKCGFDGTCGFKGA